MKTMPELSVAIPLFREQDNLPELRRRLVDALDALELSYEIVLVDDGSDDGQWELMARYAQEDPRIRAVRLARNFGLQAAATAAITEARGQAVVLMDGDLQDPPELIGELVNKWREGYQVIVTQKTSRPEGPLKRLAFRAFYVVYRWASDDSRDGENGLFSLMDRKVVDALIAMPERSRYLPGLRDWTGFRRTSIEFARGERFAGQAQSTWRLVRMAIDALMSFSKVPLRAAIVVGLFFGAIAFAGILLIVVARLLDPEMLEGWASAMTATIFMGAVNLIFLGVIAEYLGRVYDEAKQRPLYLVSDRVAAPPDGDATDAATAETPTDS